MAKTGFRAGRNEQTTQENLELLTGQRGNGLDRAITLRDLASTDLVSVSKSASGIYTISTKSSSSAVLVPTTPTGVEVSGGFSSITVRWDIPKYTGHSHTEIWRGTMETFTDAAMIATTPASVFGDLVATGSSFYYWVRHVNTNDRAGAYNATLGTLGETSRDISELIDDITAQMLESDLIRFLNEDTAANTSAITEAQAAIASARSDIETTSQSLTDALAQAKSDLEHAIATLESTYDTEILANSTSISELTNSVASDKQAMSQEISQLRSSTTTLSDSFATQITTVMQTITSTEQSLSTLITALESNYQDADSAIIGELQTLYTTVTTELNSLTKQFSQAVSQYEAADAVLLASISELSQTFVDSESATASQIQALDSKVNTADLALSSSLSSLQQTVSDSQSTTATKITELGSRIETVEADLTANITSISETLTNANTIIAQTISQLTVGYHTVLGSQATENNARLTEVSEVIAEIDELGTAAYRAMWAMKAEAGDITAGIGILAKSDGTSQVAVSASQFFIFDPNTVNSLTPLFAVSNGAVTIPKAFIEEATIQVLNAQTITADYVKSGISIETPTLTSAVINGAELNIGSGGTYGGFHTKITAQGIIYTDYLVASGGSLDNIVINQNCTIKGTLDGADGTFSGTVYANKIVGDVVGGRAYSVPYTTISISSSTTYATALNITIVGNNSNAQFERTLVLSLPVATMYLSASGGGSDGQSGSAGGRMFLTVNKSWTSSIVYDTGRIGIDGGTSGRTATYTLGGNTIVMTIPAGTTAKAISIVLSGNKEGFNNGPSIFMSATEITALIFKSSSQLS
jgi:ABC-type transporter Mla subunit MlaD